MGKTKKIGSMVVSTVMVASLVAGCTSNTKEEAQPSAQPSAQPAATAAASTAQPKLEFSYMMAGKWINWLKDLAWYPALKQKANATVNLVDGGDDAQYFKNVDLKIGSGDIPDAIIVNGAQADVYGAQGAFMDLKPLIEKFAPNIKKYIDANPDYKMFITSKDGKIYGLGQTYPKISNLSFYREDMLKKAGVTTPPKTSQEFTDMLVKLKNTYKDPNFYPFTGRGVYLKYAFSFNAQDIIDAQGKVHGIYKQGAGTDIKSPGFKTMVEWYKNLFDQKLIDPEWVTGTATEESWITKMITDKGAVTDDFFNRPSFLTTGGGLKNNPEFSMKVLAPFQDQNGKDTKRAASPTIRDQLLAISAKSKNAESVIRFLDYEFGPEGQTLMQYGVEGKTYKVENGKKVFTADFAVEQTKPLGTENLGMYQDRLTFPMPVNNDAYYETLDKQTKTYAKDYFDKYTYAAPAIKYTKEQQEERTNLVAKVVAAVDAGLVKLISGKRPMSEFDAFIKEMDDLGYSKIVQIDQTAYDAMKK